MANDKTYCITSSVTWYFNWIHFVLQELHFKNITIVLIGIPTILATPGDLDQFSALPTAIFTSAKMPQRIQNVIRQALSFATLSNLNEWRYNYFT